MKVSFREMWETQADEPRDNTQRMNCTENEPLFRERQVTSTCPLSQKYVLPFLFACVYKKAPSKHRSDQKGDSILMEGCQGSGERACVHFLSLVVSKPVNKD